jgi:cell division protease FtsH
MSRFFKSAAFPILIVVVLAFFASKLVGNSTKSTNYTYGDLVQQVKTGEVRSLTFDQKDNSVSVVLDNGKKYSTGYPDSQSSYLINEAINTDGENSARDPVHRVLAVHHEPGAGWRLEGDAVR